MLRSFSSLAEPATSVRFLTVLTIGHILTDATGSHIVLTLLLTKKYKVVSIDNHHNSHPKSLARVQQLAIDALPADASEEDKESTLVESVRANLTDASAVRSVFAKYGQGGVWGVIHVAAYKAVGESSEIPLTYYAVNVGATIQLSQIMSEFGCRRMVYSSSATVYGIPPVVPIPESTPLKAESVYGRTKVMSETILNDLCRGKSLLIKPRSFANFAERV